MATRYTVDRKISCWIVKVNAVCMLNVLNFIMYAYAVHR